MEIGAISAWVFGGISLIAIGIAIGRLWQRRSATASKSERTWLSRLPGGWVIGFFGGVLVVAAVGGYYVNRDSAATIGFAVIGAALVVVGAMSGRLAPGTLRIGPTGAEIPIGESQIQSGQVIKVGAAIEASFGENLSANGDVSVPDKAPEADEKSSDQPSEDAKAVMVPRDAPPVFLTQAANDVLNSLGGAERQAAWSAVANLGNTAKTANDKAIASTSAGVRYMQRSAAPGVNLIYRQMDKTSEDEPDSYVIVAIETKSHPIRSWPDDIQFWP
jgi:hypothetical protein